jgi:two-component system sensor histidine kinase UhpB
MGSNLELFARKKSGDEFPVDVMLSPVKIGDEWLVISSVRDMTEQKRIQAELAEVQHRLIDSQEAERLMLAQELHDGMIQELFSINFQLSEVEKDLEQAGLEAISRKIQISSEMTQQVVQGLRGISRNLRPPALAPFGLEQAIYSHMEHFQEIHPELTVHLDLTPDGDLLADRQRLVLFRIYQNGVSNVTRHAEANNLWITLDFDDDRIILEMKDDGKGLAMPINWIKLAREGHLGLVGTRERVEAINGKLTIKSAPGEGTLIRVVVPFS